jgi:hypothetical protein
VSGLAKATAGLIALFACACGTDDSFSGDPFPVLIDRANGAFMVSIRDGDGAPQTAVLDVLSPLTILDAALDAPVRHASTRITLLGHRTATDATLIARAQFDASALYLHPCDTPAPCTVGTVAAPTAITGVIGADSLRGDAIRFQPSRDQVFVLPDIAGDGAARDRACDAELPSPFFGGGTLVIGGTELHFSGLRPALGVCLSPNPGAADRNARGTDAAMVLSTGIGTSILGRSRYNAWQVATNATPFEQLPPATVLLPSGPIVGRLARIDSLAIVGTATAPRGACREVYAHHLLTDHDCMTGEDCPCTGATFCTVPSAIELAAEFDALVVSDELPLLQALRTELRPAQPEIDGILGVDALAAAEFDVDYPHNRMLFRCAEPGCTIRPTLRDVDSRPVVAACIARAIPALDARPAVDAGIDGP